jgi:hypothetical protein
MGFAAIYRWSVEPAEEARFARRWREGTDRLKALGGLGSCLCREDNGDFVAFARWPDEAARASAFQRIGTIEPWPGIVRFSETRLLVLDDRLSGAGE